MENTLFLLWCVVKKLFFQIYNGEGLGGAMDYIIFFCQSKNQIFFFTQCAKEIIFFKKTPAPPYISNGHPLRDRDINTRVW